MSKYDKEMRVVYAETLVELGEKDKDVVVLEADLSSSISTKLFADKFPDRFINCGIMEANMVSVAGGLSLLGKKPFAHTFGSFAVRRALDSMYLSVAYSNLGATILGSDAGVTAEHNGGTHMPLEDAGIMRCIPNAFVAEASDGRLLNQLIHMSYENRGLWYIRTHRKKSKQIYSKLETFELGKGKLVVDGKDLLIVACGIMVDEALQAKQILNEKGISVAVIDMFMLKPFDSEIILEYMKKVKGIITVENHQITNGLGSAVAEVMAENPSNVKLTRLGIKNRFGQVGNVEFLKREYEIDKDSIVNAALKYF